ncbi:MAG: hypothetical protein OEL88_02560 [Sterolibacteriaceae bacterium MAG5]|nr:hypothetical protein [Candidatus Nitricoxidireducens bremensis]
MAKVFGIGLAAIALIGIAGAVWLFVDGLQARREANSYKRPLPERKPRQTREVQT